MSETIAQDCLVKGGQLIVGGDSTSLRTVGFANCPATKGGGIPGAAAVSGPVLIGQRLQFTNVAKQGTVMISRVNPALAPTFVTPRPIISVQNTIPTTSPTDILLGNMDTPVGVTFFTGNVPLTGGINQISGPTIKKTGAEGQSFITVIKSHVESFLEDIGIKNLTGVNMQNGVDTNVALVLEKSTSICDAVSKAADQVSSVTTLNATHGIAVSKKPFDILHPTKEGHRLRYVSLEGPAAEVYVRGKLIESNVIELPDYWKGLIEPESITVNLTPIGCYQELFYEEADWGSRIKVTNAAGGPVKCSYIVYAERKDTEKNIPEYKGLTPDDYPGDNSEYRI